MRGCLLAPFRLLLFGLKSAAAGVVIAIVIGGIGFGAFRWFTSERVQPPVEVAGDQVEVRPSAADAPYIVQTTSRYYLVAAYTEGEGTLTLHGYWEERGQAGWVWHDTLLLDRFFGPWIIIQRGFD